jgi:diadenosine tetraphosphate (Ap4A) HIT family hydrolase
MPLTHEPDPRFLIAQSERWSVVLNADQTLLGRCFLLLRRPESDVTALTDAEVTELWSVARKTKSVLASLWEPEHFNYAFLMNLDPQVHFHVIPRYKGRREFAGGTFVDGSFGDHYRVGVARPLDDDGYSAVIAALRGKFV